MSAVLAALITPSTHLMRMVSQFADERPFFHPEQCRLSPRAPLFCRVYAGSYLPFSSFALSISLLTRYTKAMLQTWKESLKSPIRATTFSSFSKWPLRQPPIRQIHQMGGCKKSLSMCSLMNVVYRYARLLLINMHYIF